MKVQSFKEWCLEHKSIIIGAGITIVTATVAILIFKKYNVINKNLVPQIAKTISNSPKIEPPPIIINIDNAAESICSFKEVPVDLFIRNLPEWQHPSLEKIEQAAKLGINLGEHQTIVNPSVRRYAA